MDGKTKVTLHGGSWHGDAHLDLSVCYPSKETGSSRLARSNNPIVYMFRILESPYMKIGVNEWYEIDGDQGWLCHCHVATYEDSLGEGERWLNGQILPGDSIKIKSE